MRARGQSIIDKAIWLLSTLFVVSIVVFEAENWGQYLFIGCAIGIFILSSLEENFRIRLSIDKFVGSSLVFLLFCFASSIWAISPSSAISRSVTVVKLIFCVLLIYSHYRKKRSTEQLISVLIWSSYFVSLYTILFYGLDKVVMGARISSARLTDEFANVNSISLLLAVGCMFQVFEMLYKKKFSIFSLLLIPSVIVIAATQSRKAIVFLGLGVVAAVYVNLSSNSNSVKRILATVLTVGIAFSVLQVLANSQYFGGVLSRFRTFRQLFTGGSDVDNSSVVRLAMIREGLSQFLKLPIGGIGIGNSYIVTREAVGFATYLHNNYVEMLCCGGVLGFLSFYEIYYILIKDIVKNRISNRKYAGVFLTWIMIMLIMELAAVTYYNKTQWFYFMVLFVFAKDLQENPNVYN